MSFIDPARVLIGAALAAGLTLAVASPAAAHDPIVGSTPAADEVVTELPAEFRVESGEPMLYVGNDEVFGLWARDAAGLFYGDGCVTVAGASMTTVAALGEPGAYTLVAEFISIDGHPTTADIPFEWAPAGEYESATGTEAATRCGDAAEETPEPAPTGAATEAPESTAEPAPEAGADIPDVWWAAGAVGAVAIAAAVTAVVMTAVRRRRE